MSKKILIIDEEYWSIEPAIDRIETEFGKIISYSSDGSEGLSLLNQNDYACIILDIMFPLGEDLEKEDEASQSMRGGLVVLKIIRETLNLKVPVICFTIRDDDEVKKEIQKYGAFHITKLNHKALEILMVQLRKHLK